MVAVDRDEFFAKESEFKTDEVELFKNAFEGDGVVLAEIGDGAVVGTEIAGEPDGLEVFAASALKSTARASPLEVAPEVEFKQSAGMIGTATFRKVGANLKTEIREIELIDESVDGTHRTRR